MYDTYYARRSTLLMCFNIFTVHFRSMSHPIVYIFARISPKNLNFSFALRFSVFGETGGRKMNETAEKETISN